jgi:predicted DNA-binding ribbon-helix-helix protein
MKSLVIRRSIVVTGHPTSISCEDAFWSALKEIAKTRNVTVSNLVAAIDAERQHGNLSSAIRLFVLGDYRKQLSDLNGGNSPAEVEAATQTELRTYRVHRTNDLQRT